jgi:uncharacterized protein YukE
MANSILAKMSVLISANTAAFEKGLKQSESALGRFSGNIVNAGRSIAGVFGALAAFQGVKAAIGIMADFEHTMSEVRAITGATGREFEALERDARRLGASTKFTATEVGKLQVAYGRLGFTTREILNATEATLDLAAATGEDLAKAADVAGSTVRGFQLNAKETQRVVDVMASSFNKTALGLDNFTEAMKYVAPVANAAGATVEETTALLGTLADAGIRGSMAGTSLRKIFTDMTKDGRPLSERLAELAAKGITLQDSFDEVGRTAQTSLLILSKNTDKTNELTKAFQNVSGEAAKMARIMQDNLTGDVDKLSSAWEGLILKMSNTSWMRKVAQDLTGLLNLLSGNKDIEGELDKFAQAIKETNVQAVFDDFIKILSETRRELGKPIDTNIVQELAEKYKLTDEQANKLYSSVLEINNALSFQEKAIQQFNEFAKRNGYEDLTVALEDYKKKLYELIVAEQISREGFRKSAAISEDAAKAFTPSIKAADDQIAAYRRVINVLNEYALGFEKAGDKTQPVVQEQVRSLKYLKDRLKSLNDQYEQTAITDNARRQGIALEIRLLGELIAKEERLQKFLTERPDIVPKKGTDFLTAVGLDTNSINKRLKEVRISMEGLKPPPHIEQAWIDLSGAIGNSISTIAHGIGEAAAGVGNFGDSVLKAVAGFAAQLGEALIGIGTAMLAAKLMIKNPYTAIAAGVALVALSAALGASINRAQKDFNAGGSGGGGSASFASNNSQFATANGTLQDSTPKLISVIKGQDLWIMMENVRLGNGFTKSGG